MLPHHTGRTIVFSRPRAAPLADAISTAPDAAALERETAPAEGASLAVRSIVVAATTRRGGLFRVRDGGWADEGPAAHAAAAASDRATTPNALAARAPLGAGGDEAAGHPPDA